MNILYFYLIFLYDVYALILYNFQYFTHFDPPERGERCFRYEFTVNIARAVVHARYYMV